MADSPKTSIIDTTLDAKTLLAEMLNVVSDGIVVIGQDCGLRVVNSYAEKLFGINGREVIGKSIDGLFTLEDEKENVIPPEKSPWHIALEARTPIAKTIYKIVRTNGERVPISLSAAPTFSPENRAIEGVIIAIEDKAIEAEVTRMKNEFIPFAAHQLRTPLGSIRWNTEIILSGRLGNVPSYLMPTIISMYDSIHQLIRLVNDLLNLSRIDEGRIPNDPVDIDVASVIKSSLAEMQRIVEKRGLTLEVTVSESLPKLYLDAGRFRDVVQNIISNAVKFNIPGGKVTVSASSVDGHIEINVTDTGLGIPEDEKKHVFEKFFRGKNVVASQIEGTGLGLYVIKYYIDTWGGKISIESEENKGTSVRINLPVATKETK